ncbi:hypothetical protein H2203_007989 [Taxawa tesnikishii (nom. ined.)]|nr:hypothetical protein H2203_007989 [Dothideales sp. JES 119]
MAQVVLKDVAQGAQVQGQLLAGKNFYILQRVPVRSHFAQLVQNNGGRVLKLENQADYVIADHMRSDAPPGSLSYKFIERWLQDGKEPPQDEHLAGRPKGTPRPMASAIPGKSTRTPFTAEDDRILWDWVKKHEAQGGMVKGLEIYKQLEAVNSRHTYQSWRDRYVKTLMTRPPPSFATPPATSSVQAISAEEPPQAEQSVANQLRHRSPVPKLNASKKKGFTSVDFDHLMSLASDITNIPEESKDAAWEAFATEEEHNHHTAHDWRTFWETEVHPEYVESQFITIQAGEPAEPASDDKERLLDYAVELLDDNPDILEEGDGSWWESFARDKINRHRTVQEWKAFWKTVVYPTFLEIKEARKNLTLSETKEAKKQEEDGFQAKVKALIAAKSRGFTTPDFERVKDFGSRVEGFEDEDATWRAFAVEPENSHRNGREWRVLWEDVVYPYLSGKETKFPESMLDGASESKILKRTQPDSPSEHEDGPVKKQRVGSDAPHFLNKVEIYLHKNTVDTIEQEIPEGSHISIEDESDESDMQSQIEQDEDGLMPTSEVDKLVQTQMMEDMERQNANASALTEENVAQLRAEQRAEDARTGRRGIDLLEDDEDEDQEDYASYLEETLKNVANGKNVNLQELVGKMPRTQSNQPAPVQSSTPRERALRAAQEKPRLNAFDIPPDEDELEADEAEEDQQPPWLSLTTEASLPTTSIRLLSVLLMKIATSKTWTKTKQSSSIFPNRQAASQTSTRNRNLRTMISRRMRNSSPTASKSRGKAPLDPQVASELQAVRRRTLDSDDARALDTQAIYDAETQQPDLDIPDPEYSPTHAGPELDLDLEDPITPTARTSSASIVETSTMSGEEVDAYFTAQTEAGYSEGDIITALKVTSMRPELAEIVLKALKRNRGVPKNIAGIWTEEDDKAVEGGDAVKLRRLEKVHGSEEVFARLRFLGEYRGE